jgi:hypothetical protein
LVTRSGLRDESGGALIGGVCCESSCTTFESTPACDKMGVMGQWNTAWDPFVALNPEWTDESMAAGGAI